MIHEPKPYDGRGKADGASKARPSHQARAAALAGHAKRTAIRDAATALLAAISARWPARVPAGIKPQAEELRQALGGAK